MAQLGRPGLLSSQKAEAWEQWKRGKSLSDIGRVLGKHAGSIHGIIAANGGIVPLPRRRSRLALTAGGARRDFARDCRGPVHPAHGRSTWAASFHGQSRICPTWRAPSVSCRGGRLAFHPILQRTVADKLSLEWSPEQIAGWLRRTFRMISRCRCPTKPSIGACSFKPVASSRKN